DDMNPGGWMRFSTSQLADLNANAPLKPNGEIFAQGNIYNALLFNANKSSLIDNIITGNGNNLIVQNSDNNTIQGGLGTNTVVYTGKSTDHKFSTLPDSFVTVADLRPGSPDGTDQDRNIQWFNFSDGSFYISQLTNPPPSVIQKDYVAFIRTDLPLDQATTIFNAIVAGSQTETQYINSLISQVGNTTIAAVTVEASMYGAVGTSAQVTKLAIQVLPGQVAFAMANNLNTVAVSSEALGTAFAFTDENGGTAFANNFGPSNPSLPNSTAGDAAFAAAASAAIFGSAATGNTPIVIQNFVAFWKGFFSANGISGIPNPTADQVDLAARGTAWGDAVGIALDNKLGPLYGQTVNFLADAAQGMAVYSASLASQKIAAPFQGSTPSALAALSEGSVNLTGVAPHLDHALI